MRRKSLVRCRALMLTLGLPLAVRSTHAGQPLAIENEVACDHADWVDAGLVMDK